MPVDCARRICCRSVLHSLSSSRYSTASSVASRKFSQHSQSQSNTPGTVDSADAIAHLRRIFPPLEFPPDVAQRMTTHVSWNRGVHGHNGRLSFVGRRVLHTYLLLFLHECSLPPRGHTHPDTPPRHSALSAGNDPPSQPYDEISDRLLNTYQLGEHVGAAWRLERIMRWTPAIAELDTIRAESPHAVLHRSGLYKVRGATVEGVVGGIFHQFGGAIAHRVFHTRVLPHLTTLGLPESLRARAEEACERLGGREGLLVKSSARSRGEREREGGDERHRAQESREHAPPARDRLENVRLERRRDMERQKLGYVG